MSSFRALRPDQLEGMSKLGGSLLQVGICVIASALGSSYFYIILLLAVKKPNKALGRPQGLQGKSSRIPLCLLQMTL